MKYLFASLIFLASCDMPEPERLVKMAVVVSADNVRAKTTVWLENNWQPYKVGDTIWVDYQEGILGNHGIYSKPSIITKIYNKDANNNTVIK